MAKSTGANLGFEEKLWTVADKLRGSMDASEYKHIVLGLIFMKYISDSFMHEYRLLQTEEYSDPEDPDAQKLITGDNLLISEGYIALQAESHPAEFRNIEVLKLK